jgi:hypothetical protein
LPLFITQWANMADWSLCGFEINPWAWGTTPSDLDGVWGLKTMIVYRDDTVTLPQTYFNIRPLVMKTKLHMYRPSKCLINKNT